MVQNVFRHAFRARVVFRRQYQAALIPVFTNFLIIAMQQPVLPKLLEKAFGDHIFSVAGWVDFFVGVLSFLTAPLWGVLSDHYGRKRFLIATAVVNVVPQVLFLSLNVRLLLAAQIAVAWANSLLGLSLSYVADCTLETERSRAFGQILASIGVALVVGPAISIVITQAASFQLVQLILAILAVANPVYMAFFMVESNEARSGGKLKLSLANPFRVFPYLFSRLELRGTLLCLIMSSLAGDSVLFLITRYITNRFHFSTTQTAMFLMAFGLTTVIGQGVLVRVFVKGLGEKTVLRIALVVSVTLDSLFAVAWIGWMVYPIVCLNLLGLMSTPVLNAIASRLTPEREQGQVLGALAGVKDLAKGISPLAFGQLLTKSEGTDVPGWPFFIAAGLAIAAFGASYLIPDIPPPHVQAVPTSDPDVDSDDDAYVQKTRRYAVADNSQSTLHIPADYQPPAPVDDTPDTHLLSQTEKIDAAAS